ncbi:MAG TPA: hypothetical protein VM422_10355, partial [Amaricoccus sp.]|nr:hypothetical protein [Amaricoccus sp.]
MAQFRVGPDAFADFDTIPVATASGDYLVLGERVIRIETATGFETFLGRFDYVDGAPLGTILGYRSTTPDLEPVYSILDAQVDVLDLRVEAEFNDQQK